MEVDEVMTKKINPFIYWLPRILSAIYILFLSLFSLDGFSPELSLWETLVGLFIHNIPQLILLVILIAAWRYEIVGGIGFIAVGLFYLAMISRHELWSAAAIIAGPALLIGVLFIINWIQKRKL